MCHRLFNTSWDQDAARRRAAEQQETPRAQDERQEPRKDKVARPQEERRVEAEVEVD